MCIRSMAPTPPGHQTWDPLAAKPPGHQTWDPPAPTPPGHQTFDPQHGHDPTPPSDI